MQKSISMQKLIPQFALAGLAAVSTFPAQSEENHTNQQPTVDMLAVAKSSSTEIMGNAAAIRIMTKLIRDLAEQGRVRGSMCDAMRSPESVNLPRDLMREYAESVAAEVRYGGETEKGQKERLESMGQLINEIGENVNYTLGVCSAKFSI